MKELPLLALVALASCSARRTWSEDADAASRAAAASPRVTCVTTQTCSLACDDASAWTTTTCVEGLAPSACVDSSDEGRAYGCAFACSRSARVFDGSCANAELDPH